MIGVSIAKIVCAGLVVTIVVELIAASIIDGQECTPVSVDIQLKGPIKQGLPNRVEVVFKNTSSKPIDIFNATLNRLLPSRGEAVLALLDANGREIANLLDKEDASERLPGPKDWITIPSNESFTGEFILRRGILQGDPLRKQRSDAPEKYFLELRLFEKCIGNPFKIGSRPFCDGFAHLSPNQEQFRG